MKEERYPYLDGWRGIAILMVLIAHFGPKIRPDLGLFGVDLFFVLSGLLMSRILFEQRMPIGKFYRRRIARIMPVFLVFVFVCWFGWSGHGASWQELVTTLTFTRTYYTNPTIWHSVLPDGNLWSLNVEEQCYVILASIAAVSALRRYVTGVLFSLAAFTLIATKLHMHFDSHFPYLLTIGCASGGLLLSAGYRTISNWKAPAWLPIAALLAALPCYCGIGPWYLEITAVPVLLAFSVNHIADSPRWMITALEWAPLRQLGVLSYSIYLWQQIFKHSQSEFPFHTAIIAAIVVGCVSYYLFEKPTRTWLNLHWGSGSSPSNIISTGYHPG